MQYTYKIHNIFVHKVQDVSNRTISVLQQDSDRKEQLTLPIAMGFRLRRFFTNSLSNSRRTVT